MPITFDTLPEFPIIACQGPGRDVDLPPERFPCTAESMGSLAQAGFNLNWSSCGLDNPAQVLDLARDAGVKMITGIRGARGWDTDIDESFVAEQVRRVRDHEGLFGYVVDDEPFADRFAVNAQLFRLFRQHDPEHYVYYNHWAPGMSWHGFHSYEEMLDRYFELCRPTHVSADLYPIEPVSADDWQAHKDSVPWYFPRHRARLLPHYFEMLEILRQYARKWDVPLLAWTLAAHRYLPETAEGEMRFQLMTGLAYGARGLQYFGYYANWMLADHHGEPTANWHIARRINQELKSLGQVIRRLRHIGVYHHPGNLPYTRLLDQHCLGHKNDLFSRGDPIVVGQFLDDQYEYALIVNRSPFEPGQIEFHFGTDDEVLGFNPQLTDWIRPWPYNPRKMSISLPPGEGRLYRFHRDVTHIKYR
jgi:hypothetical protein